MKGLALIQKNPKIAIISVIVLLILLSVMFNKQNILMDKESKSDAEFKKIKDKELTGYVAKPEDYKVSISSVRNQDISQMQMDFQTKKALGEANVLETMQLQGAFKGVQKSPSKYEAKVERIDARIEEFKKQLAKDPDDLSLQGQINNLYHMRSILTNLEDAVIEKDAKR